MHYYRLIITADCVLTVIIFIIANLEPTVKID
jgi:hypothetical protein